ncbi:MAG: hypothetical protein LQ346_006670 [Caloplaca aetnensis]|nr:MAG: hypothetical protein LQ346_006670 [Caloplaca aetnensis]
MSSTGFSASVTWTVKPINGTGNGYVKRVTLSREWSDSGSRRSRYQNRSENVIDILRYYWIVSVTVKNSIAPWTELQHLDGRVRFHILLDAETQLAWSEELPSFINLNRVPPSFRPQHALHKARALEFFRRAVLLDEDDWVLHLDEETLLDSYAMTAVIDFIERGDEHIGIGTMLFNAGAYWQNPFLTAAEMYRVVSDWGLFRFPLRLCQRPICGFIHGAYILINGGIENAVTWDTSCVAEDFWFGLQAVRLGARFGWIDAIAREQPPLSFSDLIKQRRRCSLYSIFLRSTLLILPLWVLRWTAFDVALILFSAGSCSIIQDLDAGGIGPVAMVLHALFSGIFLPVYTSCEALIKAYAILYPSKGFHVIEKV